MVWGEGDSEIGQEEVPLDWTYLNQVVGKRSGRFEPNMMEAFLKRYCDEKIKA
jgi:hypothetical protein